MNNLAIVPARGGSKRLKGKNLKLLDGKPLVQHSVEAVLNSGMFSRILLSSDDDEILEIADQFDEVTADKRDPLLAKDTTKVLELIVQIAQREGYADEFDTIGLFLPTCPFRQPSHIQGAFKELTDDVDSIVSITSYEFPPQLCMGRDEETKIINPDEVFNPSGLITGNTRSQDQKPIYRPNGGFYISWIRKFLVNQNYFKGTVKGYYMDRINSVDIDDKLDFQWAQFLINNDYFQFEGKAQ